MPNTATCALQLIESRKLMVEASAGTPRQNRLTFVSKRTSGLPSAGSEPTTRGAVLLIRDGGGQHLTVNLPAEHWKALGKPNDPKGYKYIDRKRRSGPCSFVRVKAGKPIKAICKGQGITIRPPLSQPVEVTVRMGTFSYCAAFDGNFARNRGGSFVAKGGVVPTSCPAGLEPPLTVRVDTP